MLTLIVAMGLLLAGASGDPNFTSYPGVLLARTAETTESCAEVRAVIGRVSPLIGSRDFEAFAVATAMTESRCHNRAWNPSDGRAARVGSARSSRWAEAWAPLPAYQWGSGGLYGFLPTTALSGCASWCDPAWIFDPAISTLLLAEYARSIGRNYLSRLPPEKRTWLAVRKSMAGLEYLYDVDDQLDESRRMRERFESRLVAAGFDPGLADRRVDLRRFPGFEVALRDLVQNSGS
jgi:hypothetical protein